MFVHFDSCLTAVVDWDLFVVSVRAARLSPLLDSPHHARAALFCVRNNARVCVCRDSITIVKAPSTLVANLKREPPVPFCSKWQGLVPPERQDAAVTLFWRRIVPAHCFRRYWTQHDTFLSEVQLPSCNENTFLLHGVFFRSTVRGCSFPRAGQVQKGHSAGQATERSMLSVFDRTVSATLDACRSQSSNSVVLGHSNSKRVAHRASSTLNNRH